MQSPLRKELHNYFGKVLLINFAKTWSNFLKHCIPNKLWLMEGYVQGALQKELRNAPFVELFKNNYFWKNFLINFASTWNNLHKHCISNEFLLVEGYVQGAIRTELHIAPFVERFKTSVFLLLWEVLLINFASTRNNLLKHCISAEFLLMGNYE